MKDLMLDVETLGNGPRPVLLAIGAVWFDANGLGESFYVRVAPQSCVEIGLEMDASTVMWWMAQSAEARAELARPAVDIVSALNLFSAFVGDAKREVRVWGNGAAADNVWVDSAYRAAKMTTPWEFWNSRCYRTIKGETPEIKIERVGTHHNAVEDAKSQALHLIAIWRAKRDAIAAAAARAEALVLCLERCRASLEHHEETAGQHGEAEMHRNLYEQMSEAIRVLDKHRGCETLPAYWERVSAFRAEAVEVVQSVPATT